MRLSSIRDNADRLCWRWQSRSSRNWPRQGGHIVYVKVAAAGASPHVPLGYRDDSWPFPQFDPITVSVAGASRLNEPWSLYESSREFVLLERWAPGIILVLGGSFTEGSEEFTRLSWLRLPAGATQQHCKPRRDGAAAKFGSSQAIWRMRHTCRCSLTCLQLQIRGALGSTAP
jgi:hypothetical protein